MQIKTTRYLCIPTRTFIIRKIWKRTSVGEHMEKLAHLNIAGGNVKRLSCCRKQFISSSKS
jgi:hypothetical protein